MEHDLGQSLSRELPVGVPTIVLVHPLEERTIRPPFGMLHEDRNERSIDAELMALSDYRQYATRAPSQIPLNPKSEADQEFVREKLHDADYIDPMVQGQINDWFQVGMIATKGKFEMILEGLRPNRDWRDEYNFESTPRGNDEESRRVFDQQDANSYSEASMRQLLWERGLERNEAGQIRSIPPPPPNV